MVLFLYPLIASVYPTSKFSNINKQFISTFNQYMKNVTIPYDAKWIKAAPTNGTVTPIWYPKPVSGLKHHFFAYYDNATRNVQLAGPYCTTIPSPSCLDTMLAVTADHRGKSTCNQTTYDVQLYNIPRWTVRLPLRNGAFYHLNSDDLIYMALSVAVASRREFDVCAGGGSFLTALSKNLFRLSAQLQSNWTLTKSLFRKLKRLQQTNRTIEEEPKKSRTSKNATGVVKNETWIQPISANTFLGFNFFLYGILYKSSLCHTRRSNSYISTNATLNDMRSSLLQNVSWADDSLNETLINTTLVHGYVQSLVLERNITNNTHPLYNTRLVRVSRELGTDDFRHSPYPSRPTANKHPLVTSGGLAGKRPVTAVP
ncbi:GP74 [Caviid betaherpesvirus 2]|uniref:GP74 n=1 Tax=Guinea pig cytomegalovirus (strain 22122) TaxID=103920 RepID=B7TPY1_GPCMV|nr:GP74 [Caviid betaherpesvirus 2]AGE11543.1 GP74 [Caviid betaherpesvirus 2]AIL83931.1 GP74 [BAC cloning vector GPN13BACdenovo_preserved(MM)]BAJ78532.1 GP74 [Caviid betaherpesvirus 2]